jgi:glycosyltransferase involved in cell wall biosynthesis
MAVPGKAMPIHLQSTVIAAECYSILNDTKAIYAAIVQILGKNPDANLFLAMANLESSIAARIAWINKALQLYGLPGIIINDSGDSRERPPFDCLLPGASPLSPEITGNPPRVSVIMPVYNAASTIHTALQSVLGQTWPNMELLVVDDGSSDDTRAIVGNFARKDARVRLIRSRANRGTYVARNLALKDASGDFVTTHDADDWSHPLKIETQVQHLIRNPDVMANTSQMVRVTADLQFYRRGNPGFYINDNLSSLMFRRAPVIEAAGYWDSVRFGADGEFKRRLIKIFGRQAVVELPTGPLCFLRQSDRSLTGDHTFGYHGFFMGARREYYESYSYYHQKVDSLYYPFPQRRRLFPVPEPLWLVRETKRGGRRKFDVIIASDFRLPGGTSSSNAEEIKAKKRWAFAPD